ncbi:MAG: Lrp/AsnC ligand binding domain-containing protein [Bacteroidales bacterium]|nr:Lrp/AsnC ligand binding domain-containing protein [Bacteroidales bacterium]
MKYNIDDIDRRILYLLIKDARAPFLEIAREVGISGTAIHQRVERLREKGVITGSQVLVEPTAIGLNVCAFVNVAVTEAGKLGDVIKALKEIPEVVECHFITGKYSLFVKIYCRDNAHLMEVLMGRIRNIPCVQGTETMISLEEAFQRQVWVKE